jgi:exodeoxyribonuclease VII large subunit
MFDSKNNISVSQLVFSIKEAVEKAISFQEVVGEVSNLVKSSAGHYYFTLSDANSSIACVFFKLDAHYSLISQIKNGDSVKVAGNVTIYAKRGQFQINVKKISKHGVGDLSQQFELLKQKLAKNGLFDLSVKKTIPQYPARVAIVTALNGAALQDFINVYLRRCFECDLLIVPTIVQGADCPTSVITALEKLSKIEKIEVVVIARGGGSQEDLWAFNDERLINYLFRYPIPLISAIGHQVDYTLCDYVADHRSETPSAAAEQLTQAQTQLLDKVERLKEKLYNSFLTLFLDYKIKLDKFSQYKMIQVLQEKYYARVRQLERLNLSNRYYELTKVSQYEQLLDELTNRLVNAVNKKYLQLEQRISNADTILRVTNPQQVLNRGYAIIKNNDGVVLASKDSYDRINKDEPIQIRFHDGEVKLKKV